MSEAGGLIGCRRSVMDETRSWLEVPMQHKRIEVGSVRPHDGSEFLVYSHVGEEVWIGQGLEYGTSQLPDEIDISRAAVAEAESESIVTKYLDGCDGYELHRLILRQGIDRLGMSAGADGDRADVSIPIGRLLLIASLDVVCAEDPGSAGYHQLAKRHFYDSTI